jgi:hypothetical protein
VLWRAWIGLIWLRPGKVRAPKSMKMFSAIHRGVTDCYVTRQTASWHPRSAGHIAVLLSSQCPPLVTDDLLELDECRLLGCYAVCLCKNRRFGPTCPLPLSGWQLVGELGTTFAVTSNRSMLRVWFLQGPHGVTSQKTAFFIVTAVKVSNFTVLDPVSCCYWIRTLRIFLSLRLTSCKCSSVAVLRRHVLLMAKSRAARVTASSRIQARYWTKCYLKDCDEGVWQTELLDFWTLKFWIIENTKFRKLDVFPA